MGLEIRTEQQMLNDALDFTEAVRPTMRDRAIGAVRRALLESAVHELGEQNFQLASIPESFSIRTATGRDLEQRVRERVDGRLPAAAAKVSVIVSDGRVPATTFAQAAAVGATSIFGLDTTAFPAGTWNAKLGEGTSNEESVTVTDNDVATGELTLSAPLAKPHNTGDRITKKRGSALPIQPGHIVQKLATASEPAVRFFLRDSATIQDGDLDSPKIIALCEQTGRIGNTVGPDEISDFGSAVPFDGATVRNPEAARGGRIEETDQELRDRALKADPGLGTPGAVESGALATETDQGERAFSVKSVDDLVEGEAILYVDDGSPDDPDRTEMRQSQIDASGGLPIGSSSINVDSPGTVSPATGFAPFSAALIGTGTGSELVFYTSLVPPALKLRDVTTKTHADNKAIVPVEVLALAAEPGERFFKFPRGAIRRGTDRIWVDSGAGFILKTIGTDYLLNRGNGDVEFVRGLSGGSVVVMAATTLAGVFQSVQNSSDGDPVNYAVVQGTKALGIRLVVEAPRTRHIRVRGNVSALTPGSEDVLRPLCQGALADYAATLGVGANWVQAQALARIMAIPGVADFSFSDPPRNVTVLEDEILRIDQIVVV